MTDLTIAGSRRSFSQLSSWLQCGESYRLERIVNVPRAPAWWFVGGSAFHEATEWVDRGYVTDPSEAWAKAWNDELARTTEGTDIPQDQWRSGGRKTKDKPNGDSGSWWFEAGEQMVKDYVTWRQNNPEWVIVDLDGQPGIEWDGSAEFGGVPVKAFIDRIFASPTGEMVVVDLKTGTRKQPPTQVSLYATIIEKVTGVRPKYGAYFMSRKGGLDIPEDLSRLGIDYWDRKIPMFDKAISNEIFIPNLSPMCNACGVNAYCEAFGGELAAQAKGM